MPKEYRHTGRNRSRIYTSRAEAGRELDGTSLMERDVSAWRLALPESGVLAELRRLRSMDEKALSAELGEDVGANPYGMDAAVLLYLIRAHGCDAVKSAVREMLGVDRLPPPVETGDKENE